MAIPINTDIVNNIKAKMATAGFNISNAPLTEAFLQALVEEVMSAVKSADVTTSVATAIPTTCPAGVGSTTAVGTGTGGLS